MIFLDSNVLIDIIQEDPIWSDWSQEQLNAARLSDQLAINDVVYAEISIPYDEPDKLDAMLIETGITVAPIPPEALFIAGKAYRRYRAAGGVRTGVLPDFFIGAQALVARAELMTRDVRRYRTYFPALELIAPNLN